jgi:hypothetical protein
MAPPLHLATAGPVSVVPRYTDAMRRGDKRRQLGARREVRCRHHTAWALPGDSPVGSGGRESAGGAKEGRGRRGGLGLGVGARVCHLSRAWQCILARLSTI